MRTLVLSLLVLLSAASAYAKGAGSAAAQFLSIPPSGRAAGLGEAYVAASGGDPNSLYWNQAGLAACKSEVALSHVPYFDGVNYNFGAITLPTKDYGVFALGVQALLSGNMDRTYEDSSGQYSRTDGSYSTSETAFLVGWGKHLTEALSIGAGGKLIRQSIADDTATGWGVDVGAQYALTEMVDLGAAIANIGPQMKGNDLPTIYRAGGTLKLFDARTMLTLELDKPRAGDVVAALGAEQKLMEQLSLRAGYNNKADTDGLTGLHAGVGIDVGGFIFDYAFVPYGEMGKSHWLSLRIPLGGAKTGVAKPVPAAALPGPTKSQEPATVVKPEPAQGVPAQNEVPRTISPAVSQPEVVL